jgi:signal transduction histidine kinase
MPDLEAQGEGMRIQTRFFLGTALIVLVLTATQWWLHRRQLAAIERELGVVATAVGKGILDQQIEVLVHTLPSDGVEAHSMVWFDGGTAAGDLAPPPGEIRSEVDVVVVPESGSTREVRRMKRVLRSPAEPGGAEDGPPNAESGADEDRVELRLTTVGEPGDRFLVLTNGAGFERRIPIPVSPTQRILRETANRGLAVGAGLLVVGLAVSGLLASRVTKPLRGLAAGAEAVGRGELGVQVREDAAGEVGDLQRAFNRMSSRLATLEAERARWLEREHLAQLGDLSRGLAHTVRNPLNTLGLAVEELAHDRSNQVTLVATARAQIRRIDRWLRSFLALSAGEAAAAETIDLRSLVSDVALEAIQDGASVDLRIADAELPVRVVPTALRAAVANLVENAVEASPNGVPAEVEVRRDGDDAVVTVSDRGQGLPEEVRARLFAPHVTTKAGGAGMGLFLARQLVVGMHGGRLEMTDGPAGGTVAEVRLQAQDGDDEA